MTPTEWFDLVAHYAPGLMALCALLAGLHRYVGRPLGAMLVSALKLRESVDQLATQVAAIGQQLAAITALQATQHSENLRRIAALERTVEGTMGTPHGERGRRT